MNRDERVKNAKAFLNEKPETQPSAGADRIFLMRHGRTALDDTHRSDGLLDLPLSDEGRQSVVESLAEHLKGVKIGCIYAAPLRRTEETAHILASGMSSKPEIEIDPGFLTWDLGELAGTKKQPNKPFVKHLLENPDVKSPGGQSYNDFTEKFDKRMDEQMEESPDEAVLIVLSGSNLRRLSERLFGDRNILDLDEAGLAVMFPQGDEWTAVCICGHKDVDDEVS